MTYTIFTLTSFLVLAGGVFSIVLDENKCSKFEYEYKILERIIFLENKNAEVEKQQVVLSRKNEELVEIIKEQRLEMERLNEGQNEAREKLKSEVTITNSAASDPGNKQNISFTARMQIRRIISNVLIFDNVINNDGNGYNPTTGKFTAPVDGKYLFSTTITMIGNTHVRVYVMKNDVDIGRMHPDKNGYNDLDAASVTAVVNLNQGDVVFVKFLIGSSGKVSPDSYTSFSGVLIHS